MDKLEIGTVERARRNVSRWRRNTLRPWGRLRSEWLLEDERVPACATAWLATVGGANVKSSRLVDSSTRCCALRPFVPGSAPPISVKAPRLGGSRPPTRWAPRVFGRRLWRLLLDRTSLGGHADGATSGCGTLVPGATTERDSSVALRKEYSTHSELDLATEASGLHLFEFHLPSLRHSQTSEVPRYRVRHIRRRNTSHQIPAFQRRLTGQP